MEFFSVHSLGKLDELNKTFNYIQERVKTLENVTYKSDTATYTIFEVKPHFFYRDSKQKGEIVGNDTVIVSGGDLVVTLQFNWTRTGTTNITGSGTAAGDSHEISFYYKLVINDGFLVKHLEQADNVTFAEDAFKIIRISPPEATEEDR